MSSAAAAAAAVTEEPSAKRKKSGPAKTKPTQTMAHVAPVRLAHCQVLQHPVDRLDLLNKDALRVVELLIPAAYYHSSPQSFFGLKGSEGLQFRYKQALMVCGYLAMQVHALRERKEETGVVRFKSPNYLSVTMERVPHKDNPSVYVCYRLRLTEHGPREPNMGLNGDLLDLLSRNDSAAAKKLQGAAVFGAKGSTVPEYSHTKITTEEWIRIVDALYPVTGSLDDLLEQHRSVKTIDHTSAYYMERSFCIVNSLEQARRLGADPRYCDPDVYCQRQGDRTLYGFANPHHVWQIAYSDLSPSTFESRHLPHIRPDVQLNQAYIDQYARQHGEAAASQFLANTSNTAGMSVSNDINSLTKRIADETEELRGKHKDDAEFILQRHIRNLTDWTPAMDEIHSPDGDAAPPIRAIATWLDGFLDANHQSARIPYTRTTRNLTLMEDVLAQLTAVSETIVAVKSSHRECLTYMLCALHVYRRIPMHPHGLLLGTKSAGKSFCLKNIDTVRSKHTGAHVEKGWE